MELSGQALLFRPQTPWCWRWCLTERRRVEGSSRISVELNLMWMVWRHILEFCFVFFNTMHAKLSSLHGLRTHHKVVQLGIQKGFFTTQECKLAPWLVEPNILEFCCWILSQFTQTVEFTNTLWQLAQGCSSDDNTGTNHQGPKQGRKSVCDSYMFSLIYT